MERWRDGGRGGGGAERGGGGRGGGLAGGAEGEGAGSSQGAGVAGVDSAVGGAGRERGRRERSKSKIKSTSTREWRGFEGWVGGVEISVVAGERMVGESGVANPEHWEKAKAESAGLGLFVRSLVGLDREAAKKALNAFISGKPLTGNQIEFVNVLIEQLTARGLVEPGLLYESPFTDVNPQGPEGLFSARQVDHLIELLDEGRASAAG